MHVQDFLKYLLRPRRPKMQVQIRPYCDVHTSVLMHSERTRNGFTFYVCPIEGCACELRLRPRDRVIVVEKTANP